MSEKAKCGNCNERPVFAKDLCTRCYGIQWRAQKKSEAEAKSTALVATTPAPLVEGEIIPDPPKQEPPPRPTSEVHLVARNPEEMKAAQSDLLEWLKGKLTEIEIEVRELNAGLEEARRNNWKTDALTRARNRAVSLETFYFKMLIAVEAGYTVIPEFPIDVFAIRVTRGGVRVRQRESTSSWGWPNIDDERSDRAPAGAGRYENPAQTVRNWEYKTKDKEGKEVTHRVTTPTDFQSEIIFPMIAARPVVMNATAEAMALKVFDQIGVCRPVQQSATGRALSGWGQGDPLIIGQILHQRASGLRAISFIIAWHLNLNEL